MLQGTKITRIRTINSMYADGKVEVYDDKDNIYRMPVETILQMVNEFKFKVEMKRKYNHLVEAELVEDVN